MQRRDQYDVFEPVDAASAAPIFRLEEMLSSQHLALRRILLRLYEIAAREAAFERKHDDANYRTLQHTRNPGQTYFIDGARGAGKTTLLVTLREVMRFLGRPDKIETKIGSAWAPRKLLALLAEEIQADIKNSPFDPLPQTDEYARGITTDLPELVPETFSFFTGHKRRESEATRQTAHFLPIIFPSDLERGQTVMEAVFSLLSVELVREVERRERKAKTKEQQDQFALFKKEADKLRKSIFSNIAKGWYLSRRDGVDAILRDSADYMDFLDKMGEAGVAAHQRVTLWRGFVNDFLNLLDAQVLVLSFDDTDNSPDATADILHTCRIFLSHPRIVTIVAGNMRAMRQSLILTEMRHLGDAVEALSNEAHETARDWRQFARQQVEEILEKTLPRSNRSYLSFRSPNRPIPTRAAKPGAAGDDFQRLFEMSFDSYCSQMLNKARDDYFIAKQRASARYLAGALETQSPEERAWLERFISWWLFRNRYGRALRPTSARHLMTLRDMTLPDRHSPAISHRLPSEHSKRLAVILFETPDNFDLLQRFSDRDADVIQWLHRQHVRSRWTGDRYIEINNRKIYEDSYSYQFVFFRTDLGIALPLRDNAEARVPGGLMPHPDGPNLNGVPPFFCRIPAPERYGLVRSTAHSLIPNNCLYFYDAMSLPDIVWQQTEVETEDSIWGGRLIYDWPQVFSFREPLRRSDASNGASVDMRALQAYLVDVVFPFATLQFGRFAQTAPTTPDAHLGMKELGREHLLSTELQHDFFKPLVEGIDHLRRQYDYLGQVSQHFVHSGPADEVAAVVLKKWRELVMERISPTATVAGRQADAMGKALKVHLFSYRWLLNDLRRGWHASRIFLNEIAESVAQLDFAGSTSPNPAPEPATTWRDGFSRSDSYEVLTRALFDWQLGRSRGLQSLIAQWEAKAAPIAPAPDGAWLSAPGEDDIRSDLRKRLQRIAPNIRPLNAATIDLSLDDMSTILKAARTEDAPEAWPFILDPGVSAMQGPNPTRDAVQGRLARSYALFIYALAPCLPSAIHVEVASVLHARGAGADRQAAKEEAKTRLHDWRVRVEKFLQFIREFRALCEFIKLRLDIWRHLRDATSDPAAKALAAVHRVPTSAGVNLSVFPDFSFISLGVHGCGAWGLTMQGEAPAEVLAPPTESVLSNAAHNLVETLNFIAMSLEMLEGPASPKAPAKVASGAKKTKPRTKKG